MKKKPTMRDVARLADVTQPTVSYVINNSATISDEVRERVNFAIKKLNYKPNYFARGLKTNKSNMIGIVIPDILNEFFASIVNELKKTLQERYCIVIQSTNYDAAIEEKELRSLIDYNVESIIFAYQPAGKNICGILKKHDRPAVILEGGSGCSGIPCINTDNFYGGYTAAKYLLDQGRKQIAYIGQNSHIEALKERRRGFFTALNEFGGGGPVIEFETIDPGNKWDEGIRLGKELLGHSLDGIVVSSDVIAVGILKSILTAGKKVPEDIAVIGYDDIPLAKLFVPALTTMAQPISEMCSMTVQKIMQGLNGEPVQDELIKPELIIRQTA
ncbi:MAG: LacI family transcriptional regulator [Treponema sp.]|nr:LacI family transcriptional regulator [Treponema sp.]